MNFDTEISRKYTSSLKWEIYSGTDIEPFWVADMEFRTSEEIISALKKRVEHGIFGYTLPSRKVTETVQHYLKENYNWHVNQESIVWIPGVVPGLELCCRAFTSPDKNEVVTFTPIYHHFLEAPPHSGAECIKVPMKYSGSFWEIDFNLLERSITEKTALLLLCSPHNPTGRIFTESELSKLAAVCERHNVIICSDEIHCDLILDRDKKHIPTATVNKYAKENTITFMSASKTYNIAGLSCAFAVIENKKLRDRFIEKKEGIVPYVNALAYDATAAAYGDSSRWLTELLEYLRENRDCLEKKINSIYGLKVAHIEATYLAWIDCRELNLKNPAEFFRKANVGLSDGREFGLDGFVRLNFACTKKRLLNAMERIAALIEEEYE